MLDNLCDYIHEQLDELDRKVKTGGKLSASDVEYGDMLAHFKKSLLTNEAMEESGYSERGYSMRGNGYSEDMRGSYARGRGRKRDSMGRYSRDGYSRTDEFRMMLEDAMESAPNEQTREKIRRMMAEV